MRKLTPSWREMLLTFPWHVNIPKMTIGDGAMGFGSALEEIYPGTRHQRCWLHKISTVPNASPNQSSPRWNRSTMSLTYLSICLRPNIRRPHWPCKRLEWIISFLWFSGSVLAKPKNHESDRIDTLRHRIRRSKDCLTRRYGCTWKLVEYMQKMMTATRIWPRQIIMGVKFIDGVETAAIDQNAAW